MENKEVKTVGVIGANGFVGTQVVNELASRGYAVKAFSRSAVKVPVAGVNYVQADVNEVSNFSHELQGLDAVISAFNPGWENPNLYEDFIRGAKNIEHAVEESGVKRFLVVGGAGSLYIDGSTQIVDTPDFPANIRPGALAARDYLNEIKKNDRIEWTYFSPAPEMHQGTSGVRQGYYRTGLENPVFNEEQRSILSVEDVAVALVDELENKQFIQKRFTAAY